MSRRRKKKDQGIPVLIVIALLCMVVYFAFPKPPFSLDEMDKRAIWVSYQDLERLDYTSLNSFEKSFKEICQTSVDNYCNTLIVHVRAFQDAMYRSDKFPMSTVIMGRDVDFDPLDVMVEVAHQYGLKFEAWINPYRISHNSETYKQFVDKSPISSWLSSNNIISYGENMYILNPGSEDVRKYIVDGVREIVEGYDVDGIHFDDYFYVDGSYDGISEEIRKENVNILIKEVYGNIKDVDKDIVFGISPQGNYENCLIGGADVDTWLNDEGYIDYLMPQIYWSDQYHSDGKTRMFSNRLRLWKKLADKSSVDLYVGLALYQSGKDLDYDLGWSRSYTNINEQIELLNSYNIKGYSLFHYHYLLDENGQKELNNLFKKHLFE